MNQEQLRQPKHQQRAKQTSKQRVQTRSRSTTSHTLQRFKQLTKLLQSQQTPEQLLALLQQHSVDLDHIHLSAAFSHARKRLCRTGVLPGQQPAAVQQLLQHLHQLPERLQQQCDARSLANIVSACGHLRMKSTVQLLPPEFLQDSKMQQTNPQAVSNMLWAVATLGMLVAED
jgi:hypothetical protein